LYISSEIIVKQNAYGSLWAEKVSEIEVGYSFWGFCELCQK